jgi:hypothetical protein
VLPITVCPCGVYDRVDLTFWEESMNFFPLASWKSFSQSKKSTMTQALKLCPLAWQGGFTLVAELRSSSVPCEAAKTQHFTKSFKKNLVSQVTALHLSSSSLPANRLWIWMKSTA